MELRGWLCFYLTKFCTYLFFLPLLWVLLQVLHLLEIMRLWQSCLFRSLSSDREWILRKGRVTVVGQQPPPLMESAALTLYCSWTGSSRQLNMRRILLHKGCRKSPPSGPGMSQGERFGYLCLLLYSLLLYSSLVCGREAALPVCLVLLPHRDCFGVR